MSDVEKIIQASEPSAWDRLAPQIPISYRLMHYVREAHRAGFKAGIEFVRTAQEPADPSPTDTASQLERDIDAPTQDHENGRSER